MYFWQQWATTLILCDAMLVKATNGLTQKNKFGRAEYGAKNKVLEFEFKVDTILQCF